MKVFISYSKEDKGAAEKLAKTLHDKGFDITHPSAEIMPGDNWALKIGKALESSKAMVVLISPHSGASSSLQHEVGHAITSPRFRGRLIPVMLHKTTGYPWILKKLRFEPYDPDAIAERLRSRLTKAPVKSAA